MKNPIYTVAALALIVGSGLVHGAWTNRWRTAPALADLAARLESVPTVLGDWTATSRAIPPRELAMAGAVGQISRVYTNPTKGLTVSVLLLCGLPGNISTHTPDVCYPGAGYTLGNGERFVHRYGVPERAETVASFLEFFRPRTGLMQGLRGLCAIGRLLIPLHVQGDTLANVFSRPH